jgi:hypothetical protein
MSYHFKARKNIYDVLAIIDPFEPEEKKSFDEDNILMTKMSEKELEDILTKDFNELSLSVRYIMLDVESLSRENTALRKLIEEHM